MFFIKKEVVDVSVAARSDKELDYCDASHTQVSALMRRN